MKKNNICLSHAAIMFLLLVATSVGYAKKTDDKFPLGCRDAGYKFVLRTLKLLPAEAGEKQSLYFIFNSLSQNINLYQMRKDDSARSTHLNHVIRARQWAVLSTDESELKYICTVDNAKLSYGKIINCAESLKVCEYVRVKYGMNNAGNHWLVSSNTSSGAVREVVQYGIIPR